MVADNLDDPASLGLGWIGPIVGMQQSLGEVVRAGPGRGVEPLLGDVLTPGRLDRVDVDPQLVELGLVLRLHGVEFEVTDRVGEGGAQGLEELGPHPSVGGVPDQGLPFIVLGVPFTLRIVEIGFERGPSRGGVLGQIDGRLELWGDDLGKHPILAQIKRREPEHQERRGRQGPGLFGPDQPNLLDLGGEKVGAQAAPVQTLRGQAVGDGERSQVVLEDRLAHDLVAHHPGEPFELLDLVAEVLLKELLQAGELEPVAQADHPGDLRLSVDAGVEPDRAVHLAGEVVEHPTHGREDRSRVGGFRGVPLQVLGLGEGELQFLREGSGEVVAADRHVPLPDSGAVGDDEVGVVRADVEQDDRVLASRTFQLVEGDEVIEGDRPHLNNVHLDPGGPERQDGPVDLVALHGEKTDLGHREIFVAPLLVVVADLLVGPDDFLKREGNLLSGFELHDVGDSLLLDRRQLDELHQARLAGNGDRHLAPFQVVPFEERLQGLANELLGVGVGLAENLGVFDEVERLGHDLVGGLARCQLQGLERGLADVEGPDGLDLRHVRSLLSISIRPRRGSPGESPGRAERGPEAPSRRSSKERPR